MSNIPEQSTDIPQTPPADAQQTPPVGGQPPPPAPAPTPGGQTPGSEKKMVAGIFGILLGSLGIHKFYLGYTVEGVIMLAVSVVGFFLCGIPTMAVWVIGLVEGILYLTKTDEEFVSTYVTGRKPWF